jgi:hypothetical protein
MPRKRNGRTSNDPARRRTNGGMTSIPVAKGTGNGSHATYLRDPRWATAVRRRTDVFVVDITDRFPAASNSSDEDQMLLSA